MYEGTNLHTSTVKKLKIVMFLFFKHVCMNVHVCIMSYEFEMIPFLILRMAATYYILGFPSFLL